MKRLILITLLLVICLTQETIALDRYIPFGNLPEGPTYFDVTTLVKQGSNIYKCTVKNPYTSDFSFQFSYCLLDVEIDAHANKFRTLRGAFYDEADRIIGQQFVEATDWQPIGHPSEIEGLLIFLQKIEKNYPSMFNTDIFQDLVQPRQPQNGETSNRSDIYGQANRYGQSTLVAPHTQERYIYMGATPTKHKAYIDTSTILYNPQTSVVKFQIKLVFDKTSFKKELNTKQFKNVKKMLSKASYNIANYYIDLSRNQYASIDSTYYSDTEILATTSEACEYQPIIPGSFMDRVKEQLLYLVR